MIAHVLIRDDTRSGAVCETQFKQDWELPGGIVEPVGATAPRGRARGHEELGIELAIGRLLVADWMPPYLGWDDAHRADLRRRPVAEADLADWSLQPTEIKARSRLVDPCRRTAELLTPLSLRGSLSPLRSVR